MGAFVRTAFEDALAGILNKRQTDVLLDIQKSKVGLGWGGAWHADKQGRWVVWGGGLQAL